MRQRWPAWQVGLSGLCAQRRASGALPGLLPPRCFPRSWPHSQHPRWTCSRGVKPKGSSLCRLASAASAVATAAPRTPGLHPKPKPKPKPTSLRCCRGTRTKARWGCAGGGGGRGDQRRRQALPQPPRQHHAPSAPLRSALSCRCRCACVWPCAGCIMPRGAKQAAVRPRERGHIAASSGGSMAPQPVDVPTSKAAPFPVPCSAGVRPALR